MSRPRRRLMEAKELLRLVTTGPAFLERTNIDEIPESIRLRIKRDYQLWSESWVIPKVKQLVPELRKLEKEKASQDDR